MDAVLLARFQFAMTIGFHYIFPPLTIGMSWIISYMLYKYMRTGEKRYLTMGRFWTKIFALGFAVGVATGITMEFQFGMNWADYSRFVGDIFGAPLAAEGIFAFFLESSFLGVLLLGYGRVSTKMYWFSSLMVAVGSTLSGFWIIVANSWQQTPAGYEIINGRAELTNFYEAVFNPSTIERYLHTIDGALTAGSFFILALAAWFILKDRHLDFAKDSFKIALKFAFIASILQLPLGHYHVIQVSETQPEKLAAFEGHWETGDNAPLLLFGIPDAEKEVTNYSIKFPGLLSLGCGGSFDTVVQGLKDFKPEDRPPIMITFVSFHVMVALGMFFIGITVLGLILLKRGTLFENKFYLKVIFYTMPLPILANELGWIAAEVGRQPWIVYHLMRTKDAVSAVVPAWQILFSIIVFAIIYALLFVVWVHVMKLTLNKGPELDTKEVLS